jgi:hypothetical protein
VLLSAMSDSVESVKTWRAFVVMEMEVVGGGRRGSESNRSRCRSSFDDDVVNLYCQHQDVFCRSSEWMG